MSRSYQVWIMSLVAPAILALSLSALFDQPIFAQSPQNRVPFPAYRIIPGKLDFDGLPTSNAQLCIGAEAQQDCFSPNSKRQGIEMPFGLAPKATKLDLKDGGSLVLFTAEFSGGGSGTLTSIALLECRSDGHLRNLLPDVGVTNQSEFRVWNIPQVSDMPLLVTADFDWNFDKGETHFAKHKYWIEAYIFDIRTGVYTRTMKYLTNKEYPGLDDADNIVVLEPERSTILAHLSVTRR